jgi:hypothetical protein
MSDTISKLIYQPTYESEPTPIEFTSQVPEVRGTEPIVTGREYKVDIEKPENMTSEDFTSGFVKRIKDLGKIIQDYKREGKQSQAFAKLGTTFEDIFSELVNELHPDSSFNTGTDIDDGGYGDTAYCYDVSAGQSCVMIGDDLELGYPTGTPIELIVGQSAKNYAIELKFRGEEAIKVQKGKLERIRGMLRGLIETEAITTLTNGRKIVTKKYIPIEWIFPKTYDGESLFDDEPNRIVNPEYTPLVEIKQLLIKEEYDELYKILYKYINKKSEDIKFKLLEIWEENSENMFTPVFNQIINGESKLSKNMDKIFKLKSGVAQSKGRYLLDIGIKNHFLFGTCYLDKSKKKFVQKILSFTPDELDSLFWKNGGNYTTDPKDDRYNKIVKFSRTKFIIDGKSYEQKVQVIKNPQRYKVEIKIITSVGKKGEMILPIHKKSGIFKKLKGKVIQTESETKETELPKLPKRKKLFSQFYDKIKKSGINSDSNMNDIKPIVNEFYKLLKSKNIEIPERLIYGDTQKIKEIFSVKPKINTEFRNAMDAIIALFEYRELKKGKDYVGFGKPSKDEIPFKRMKREVKEINDKSGSGLSGGIGLSPSDTERFVLDLISKPKKPFFTTLGTEYYPDLIIDADSLTKGKGFNPSFDFVLFRKPAKEVPDSKKKMIELKTKVETLIKSSTSNSDLIDKLDRVKGEIKGATPNIMFIDAKSLFRNEGVEASMMQPSESAMSMISRYGITKYFIMGFYYKTDPPGRPQYTEGRNKNFVYSNIKDFVNNILIRNATSDKFTALDVSSIENLKQYFEVPKQLDYDKTALDEETRRMFEERGEEIALEEKRDKLRKTLPVKLQELRNKIRDDQLKIRSTLTDIETLFRDANLGPDENTMELLTTAKHTYDQAVEMKRIAESMSEEEKRRIREEQERLDAEEKAKKAKRESIKAEEARKRDLKAQKRAKEKAEAEALKPKQKSYFEIQEEINMEKAKQEADKPKTSINDFTKAEPSKFILIVLYKMNYYKYANLIRGKFTEAQKLEKDIISLINRIQEFNSILREARTNPKLKESERLSKLYKELETYYTFWFDDVPDEVDEINKDLNMYIQRLARIRTILDGLISFGIPTNKDLFIRIKYDINDKIDSVFDVIKNNKLNVYDNEGQIETMLKQLVDDEIVNYINDNYFSEVEDDDINFLVSFQYETGFIKYINDIFDVKNLVAIFMKDEYGYKSIAKALSPDSISKIESAIMSSGMDPNIFKELISKNDSEKILKLIDDVKVKSTTTGGKIEKSKEEILNSELERLYNIKNYYESQSQVYQQLLINLQQQFIETRNQDLRLRAIEIAKIFKQMNEQINEIDEEINKLQGHLSDDVFEESKGEEVFEESKGEEVFEESKGDEVFEESKGDDLEHEEEYEEEAPEEEYEEEVPEEAPVAPALSARRRPGLALNLVPNQRRDEQYESPPPPPSPKEGDGKRKWALHKVYIKKPMSFEDAYELAHEYIKDKNKIFVKEYPNKFNFRNIPKTKFSKFRGKVINDDVTLIYGQLKPEYSHLEGSAKPPPFVGGEDMSGGQMKLREDFEYLRPLFSFQDKMSPEEFDHLLYINKPKPINKWFLGAGSGNEPETYYEQLVRRFRN